MKVFEVEKFLVLQVLKLQVSQELQAVQGFQALQEAQVVLAGKTLVVLQLLQEQLL